MKKLVSELEVGDIVLEEKKYAPAHLAVVDKVTKCFVIIGYNKYRKVDKPFANLCTSDSWTYGNIKTLTKEEIDEQKRKEEIEKKRIYLAKSTFNGLAPEVIEKVYELVKQK